MISIRTDSVVRLQSPWGLCHRDAFCSLRDKAQDTGGIHMEAGPDRIAKDHQID